MNMTVDEELVVGIFYDPELHETGRSEVWAESQQGHGIVYSRHIPRSRPP